MGKLLIFVLKKNKNYNFSIAAGVLESNNFKEIQTSISSNETSASISLVQKFQKKGINFSEIILNGTKNFFLGTPFENFVTVLKKPELFFTDFIELKQIANKIRKENNNFLVIENKNIKNDKIATKTLGDKAETITANYLQRNGHQIVVRNFKTKFYEIDIISTKVDKIYFTEVKYRNSEFRGSALSMITKKKIRKMTFAAKAFLEYRKDLKEKYSPLLAAASVSGDDFILNDWFVID